MKKLLKMSIYREDFVSYRETYDSSQSYESHSNIGDLAGLFSMISLEEKKYNYAEANYYFLRSCIS